MPLGEQLLLDLHEAVAEEFRLAADLGRRYFEDEESGTSRSTWVTHDLVRSASRSRARDAWRVETTRIVRKLRDDKLKYVIVPVSVTPVTCPRCGKLGEVREGVHGRIHHLGLGVKNTCVLPHPARFVPAATNDNGDRHGITT